MIPEDVYQAFTGLQTVLSYTSTCVCIFTGLCLLISAELQLLKGLEAARSFRTGEQVDIRCLVVLASNIKWLRQLKFSSKYHRLGANCPQDTQIRYKSR